MTNIVFAISNEQDSIAIDENIIEKNALILAQHALNMPEVLNNSALSEYDLSNITINIELMFCDDETIHEINKNYRDKDKPTDVISFALFADSEESRMVIANQIHLGEIIISTDTTAKQAKENNHSFDQELYFLLSHGILHLLGFDHLDEESYNFMMSTQNQMMVHVTKY